jgi:hypothetical protein
LKVESIATTDGKKVAGSAVNSQVVSAGEASSASSAAPPVVAAVEEDAPEGTCMMCSS